MKLPAKTPRRLQTFIRSHLTPLTTLLTVIALGGSIPIPAHALRPMHHSIALVAGEGNIGYRDADFTSARFNGPLGLAMDPEGNHLYVADDRNNRIRVIDLGQNNVVTTLTGGEAGRVDGPLNQALFNQPQALAFLSKRRLAVNDFGNQSLRLVDLSTGTVSTIVGGGPVSSPDGPATQTYAYGIYNLAYRESEDALYFTQPSQGTLKRLALTTLQVATVLSNDPNLPHPAALCATSEGLFVADKDLKTVDRVEYKVGTPATLTPVSNVETHVIALVGSGKFLYAAQTSVQAPFVRLVPQYQPVTFTSVWSDLIPDPGKYLPFLKDMDGLNPVAIICDPTQERTFYFAHPNQNIITSFRDLFINETNGQVKNTNGLTDLMYPMKKPAQTFRILMVGDSHSGEIHTLPFKERPPDGYPRQATVYKQMELELNELAALEDVPLHFEVLNLYRIAAAPLGLWPTYEVPEACKNNDIDLVMILEMGGYCPYVWYERPITSEGIPAQEIDSEYAMRPPTERIPAGDPKRFYDLCKAKNLVHIEGPNIIFPVFDDSDPELRPSLIGLYSKPLEVLKKKLDAIKTTGGKSVQLSLCSSPSGMLFPNRPYAAGFWKEVAHNLGLTYIDLFGEMLAVGYSYIPMSQLSGDDHFEKNGGMFFGRLLAHKLIHQGVIPWTPVSPDPKKK